MVKNKISGLMLLIAFIGLTVLFSHIGINSALYNENDETNSKETAQIRLFYYSAIDGHPMDELIEEFNLRNKGRVKATLHKIPREKYSSIINMMMASGEYPDVFQVSRMWITGYIMQNWLADLSAYVNEDFLDKFPEWVKYSLSNNLYNGRLYTIPSAVSSFRLIYNKKLFRDAGLDPGIPPKTIDEVKTYAGKISASAKGYRRYGFALPAAEEWYGFVLPMEVSCTIDGVYYYNFRKGEYDLNVYGKWIKTLIEMKKAGSLFPGETSLTVNTALTQFFDGNIGMMIVSNNDMASIEFVKGPDFDWGICMPPSLVGSDPAKGALMLTPDLYFGVGAAAENIEDAAELWQLLYSEKYLGNMYRRGKIIPVIKGITDNPLYTPQTGIFKNFLPSDKESVYPDVPAGILDMSRVKAYVDAFKETDNIDTLLSMESINLNEKFYILQIQPYTNEEMKKYIIRDFNPRHPLNAFNYN